jgi:hypothetical protein
MSSIIIAKSGSYLLLSQKNAYQTYIDALTNLLPVQLRESLFETQKMDESVRYLQLAIEARLWNIEDRIAFQSNSMIYENFVTIEFKSDWLCVMNDREMPNWHFHRRVLPNSISPVFQELSNVQPNATIHEHKYFIFIIQDRLLKHQKTLRVFIYYHA